MYVRRSYGKRFLIGWCRWCQISYLFIPALHRSVLSHLTSQFPHCGVLVWDRPMGSSSIWTFMYCFIESNHLYGAGPTGFTLEVIHTGTKHDSFLDLNHSDSCTTNHGVFSNCPHRKKRIIDSRIRHHFVYQLSIHHVLVFLSFLLSFFLSFFLFRYLHTCRTSLFVEDVRLFTHAYFIA